MKFCSIIFVHRVMAFVSIMVLISNSSLTETRGTVNGYGQALCAIGRALGPVAGAPLFAWSENTGECYFIHTNGCNYYTASFKRKRACY